MDGENGHWVVALGSDVLIETVVLALRHDTVALGIVRVGTGINVVLVRGILDELNIPVTVFVPVSHVESDNCWDKEEPGYQKIDILSWCYIEELAQNPLYTFGSHGMTHVSMRHLSKEQTVKDLRESKQLLKEHLQKQVDYYAFPYGQKKDFGHATPELLQEIGFKAAFTTLWKRNNLRENPYRLRRVEVKPTDTMDDFQRYLMQKPDFRLIKQEIKNILR